jgi:hypothetical protein
METMTKIELLRQLGNMSTEIGRLSQKTEKARYDYESTITRSIGPDRRAEKRWESWLAKLRIAYQASLDFSDEHKLTRLPVPDGLKQ